MLETQQSSMTTVYLDSQDFSHFSSRHKDHAKYAALKAQLLQLKELGKVCFVFSDIHFYEVYPKGGKATAEGLERIRTISEFCGKDSLPSFTALLEHEIMAELCKRRGDPVPSLSTNWFPDLGIRGQPLARPERSNRAERRKLDIALRREKSKESLTAEFRQVYPFLKHAEVFLKYYAHQAEWEDVVHMIEDSIQDIESFSTFLTSNPNISLDIPNILRSGYESYTEAITTLKNEVALRTSIAETIKQKSELSAEIHQVLTKSEEEFRTSIVQKLMTDLEGYDPKQDVISISGATPCFESFIRYLSELIRRSSQIRTPRKPAGSDFADALHVTYFPIVNVFRTDAAAADALGRLYPHRKADIIGDVFQLPNRIIADA